MALRVLLADESTTIKKVMQLALQDFAVEVKAVQAGIDVLDVARSFRPDLIFVDVLLQKKNGYEVCAAIKNDAELRPTPVVLMWSQFMDLDESLARSCGADARLEKPFDVETLRKQVLELVPKTRSQRLAHFLEFSPTLNQELAGDPSATQPPVQAAPVAQQAAPVAQQAPPQTPPPQAPRAPTAPPPPAARSAAPTPPPAPSAQPSRQQATERTATPPPAPPTPAKAAARPGPPPPDNFIRSRTAVTVQMNEIPPSAPAPTAAAKSNWTMENFEDPTAYEGNPDEEESFTPLELAQAEREEPIQLEAEADDEAVESDDMWSRQDLSQFKLDLPPISVGEGRDGFNLDMGEEEFSRPDIQLARQDEATAPAPARMRRSKLPEREPEPELEFGNDLTLDSHQINAADIEIAMPLEPLETEEILEFAPAAGERSASSIQLPPNSSQMSAEQLERVIRAQSREIIEQVVRKIVPDLATTIIREELERLLEDTAVRESRGPNPRNG